MNLVTKRRVGTERCPYCHDCLAGELSVVTCFECGTDHHRVCVEELGRCSLYGCDEGLEVTIRLDAPIVGPAARELRARILARVHRHHATITRVRAVGIPENPAPPTFLTVLAALRRWLLP